VSNEPDLDTLDGDSPPIDRHGDSLGSVGDETLVGDSTEPFDEPAPPGYADEPTHIGRYLILRRIGEGGMGVVYAAYDNELDRRVAIKLVHSRTGSDQRVRVRREAQAMARLSHPNVVQVYEVADFEQQVFVAMEFVVGPTLAEWTRAQPASPTRWRTILSKYIEVGRGLAAAHAVNLVHRDFKPANAIVGDDGRVRVLDFGIARASDPTRELDDDPVVELAHAGDSSDPLATPLTRTGALVGTPAYMSPEQFERRSVDARSDQFSFCVALYEALYGERPFAGTSTATLLINVLAGKLRPVPPRADVPSWVREVVVRGLASDPNARWPAMSALLEALEADPDVRRRRRQRAITWASAAVLTVLGSVWFARVQMRQRAEAEAEAAAAHELEALAAAREAQAQAERDQALLDARAAASRARDTARVLAARTQRSHPELAAALLRDAEQPANVAGWRSAAINALQRPMTRELLDGHTDRVVYLDVSLDGRWVASASFDGTARVWSTRGGPPLILTHDDGMFVAAFDRASKQLVTASRDGVAKVWRLPPDNADGTPGRELGEPIVLGGGADLLWSAQFSYDGSKVVTGSRDGKARLYTLDRPEQPVVFDAGPESFVWWAELSPNGRYLAAASSEGRGLVWSVEQPERPPVELRGHTASVGDIHWSPTLPIIVTASADGTARLYRFDDGVEASSLDAYAVLEHADLVHRARFSLEGQRVITSSRDRTAKVWTLGRDGALAGPPMVFDVGLHGKSVWASDFSFDGMLVALGRGDGTVQVQPLRGGPKLLLQGHTADVFRVQFSPDQRTLYSASYDGTVRVWSTELNTAMRELDGHGEGRISDLLASGRVMASASADGTARVWNIEDPGLAPAVAERPAVIAGGIKRPIVALDGFPRWLATCDDGASVVRLWKITGTWVLDTDTPALELPTAEPVRNLALDPAGQRLVAELVDGSLFVWAIDQPQPVARQLRGPQIKPGYASIGPVFSPDGSVLAAGGDMSNIEVWRREQLLADATAPIVLPGHTGRVNALEVSRDGRRLVSGSNDHSVRVWDLQSPASAPIQLDHPYFIYAATFDPKAEHVLSGCGDTNAYLWTLADPQQPIVLAGAAGEVRDVAYSPDGRTLAAAASDGSVRVWSSEGGEPIELLVDAPLSELEFVDGGRRLAAAGYGPTIWLWHIGAELDIDHLQARLRDATHVCLNPSQRTRFIGESLDDATLAYQACRAASGR
jgi:WD40 repeat protein